MTSRRTANCAAPSGLDHLAPPDPPFQLRGLLPLRLQGGLTSRRASGAGCCVVDEVPTQQDAISRNVGIPRLERQMIPPMTRYHGDFGRLFRLQA